MSTNQIIERHWRILQTASCTGTWEEYTAAITRLKTVDRKRQISIENLQAVRVIALARAGRTDEATTECISLHKEHPDIINNYIVPRLKSAPENDCKDFVAFTKALVKISYRKAMVHNLQKSTVEKIMHILRVDKIVQNHAAMSFSILAGLTIVLIAVWLRGTNSEKSVTAFFDSIKATVKTNDPSILWDSLPISLQNNCDSVIHEFGRNLPETFYDSQWNSIERVADLLILQKEFVFNTPTVQGGLINLSIEEKAQLDFLYDEVTHIIKSVSRSQLSTVSGLKNFNTSHFLNTNGKEILNAMIACLEIASLKSEEARDILKQYRTIPFFTPFVTEQTEESATVLLTGLLPDFYNNSPQIQMIKLDDRWVPMTLAYGIQLVALEARQSIQKEIQIDAEQGLLAGLSITLVNSLIAPLEQAKTQTEFDDALAELVLKFSSQLEPFRPF